MVENTYTPKLKNCTTPPKTITAATTRLTIRLRARLVVSLGFFSRFEPSLEFNPGPSGIGFWDFSNVHVMASLHKSFLSIFPAAASRIVPGDEYAFAAGSRAYKESEKSILAVV